MIASHIAPILIVSGAVTAGLIALALFPRPVSRLIFGIDKPDDLTVFLARYMGLLVALLGSLVAFSAFHAEVRTPVLIAVSTEKIFFVALVIFSGVKRTPILVVAAIADACFALLYIAYLAGL